VRLRITPPPPLPDFPIMKDFLLFRSNSAQTPVIPGLRILKAALGHVYLPLHHFFSAQCVFRNPREFALHAIELVIIFA